MWEKCIRIPWYKIKLKSILIHIFKAAAYEFVVCQRMSKIQNNYLKLYLKTLDIGNLKFPSSAIFGSYLTLQTIASGKPKTLTYDKTKKSTMLQANVTITSRKIMEGKISLPFVLSKSRYQLTTNKTELICLVH